MGKTDWISRAIEKKRSHQQNWSVSLFSTFQKHNKSQVSKAIAHTSYWGQLAPHSQSQNWWGEQDRQQTHCSKRQCQILLSKYWNGVESRPFKVLTWQKAEQIQVREQSCLSILDKDITLRVNSEGNSSVCWVSEWGARCPDTKGRFQPKGNSNYAHSYWIWMNPTCFCTGWKLISSEKIVVYFIQEIALQQEGKIFETHLMLDSLNLTSSLTYLFTCQACFPNSAGNTKKYSSA